MARFAKSRMLASCAMFLYRSNRSERLVDALAEVVRRPLSSPLAPERIVVQSKGMERWLAMQLSRRLRVFANAEFPFPRHLLERAFDRVLGRRDPALPAWNERTLLWSVAALLPALLSDPAFAPIAGYLERDADGSRRIQLAARIARVFDDYTVYRPELLSAWERGEDRNWDAQLWRALVTRLGREHQSARAERFMAALRSGAFEREALPERLCLFGIATLPPLYLSVLSVLSEHVETHLFVLSPSREYWGDLRSRRALPDRAAADAGHPLLASWGRIGREFQDLLEELTRYQERDRDLYEDPGRDSLLHALQSDVLAASNRGAPGDDAQRAELAPADASVRIHVCHSPMREIEVLHDQLAAVLEDASIEAHDIVVMTPDIEAYAPVIEAVFGQKNGRPQLPYSVSDRKTRSTHEVALALYALCDALSGRLPLRAVLDLLSLDCIRQRFAITSEELDPLRAWIEQSGIRWGQDAAHRLEVGQPELEDNTWRFGLERMLLGYAMSSTAPRLHGGAATDGPERRMYHGTLPFEAIEGGAAELLGKLCELCERLFRQRAALRGSRDMAAWHDALLALLADMVDAGAANAHEHTLIARALGELRDGAVGAGFDAAIDLRSVLGQLESLLDASLPARGLLARGITFCQLVPMRSIPFKVVCLIGLNDEAFPGRSNALGFDRMSERGERRAGDRSRRDDDRYMMLEALLSARQQLIATYVGRGVHDNHVVPPSVVIGELIDAVKQGYVLPDAGPARAGDGVDAARDAERAIEQHLCVVHRLHAFSPRYFDARGDARLFSFARHYCEGAQALGGARSDPPLLAGRLPDTPLTEITIEELIEWLTKPIASFLKQRLGLYLGDDLDPLPSREPLTLSGLDRWQLGTDLLGFTLRGADLAELWPAMRARGTLPLGAVGRVEYEELLPEIDALARIAAADRAGAKLEPLAVSFDLEGVRITGTLHGLWPGGQLCSSYSRIGRRFEFAHFIRHVVLGCALAREPHRDYPERSVVVARPADKADALVRVEFSKLADPLALLSDWLVLLREARCRPLPFVYEVARAYADAAARAAPGVDPDARHSAALSKARKEFDDGFGAKNDAYVNLVYPELEALIDEPGGFGFHEVANRLFGPFFASRSST
jgi:exodeoxyribonuclease V gamma subunit